jgi:voltage-gated potassium channel
VVAQIDFDELRQWRRTTDTPLTILAIGSLPILALNFVADRLPQADRNFIFIIDLVVFLAFAIDYVVEIFLVKNRLQYAKTEWLSLLVVLAQFAALTPALGVLGFLRAARGARVMTTLIRLGAVFSASKRQQGLSTFKTQAARLAFGLAGLTSVTSAVAFTIAEDVGKGMRVHSFFDALWWSAATITTVGYGDIYPVTATGRVIAVITMIVGISTLAIVTARVAAFLMDSPGVNAVDANKVKHDGSEAT